MNFNGDGNTGYIETRVYTFLWILEYLEINGTSLFDIGIDKKVIPNDNTVKLMLLDYKSRRKDGYIGKISELL